MSDRERPQVATPTSEQIRTDAQAKEALRKLQLECVQIKAAETKGNMGEIIVSRRMALDDGEQLQLAIERFCKALMDRNGGAVGE